MVMMVVLAVTFQSQDLSDQLAHCLVVVMTLMVVQSATISSF